MLLGFLAALVRHMEESEGRAMAGRWARLSGMTATLDQRLAQALLPTRILPSHPDPLSLYSWDALPEILHPQTLAAIDEALSNAPHTRESPLDQQTHERQREVVGLLRDMDCSASTPPAKVRRAAEIICRAHTSPETNETERGFSVRSILTDWANRRKPPRDQAPLAAQAAPQPTSKRLKVYRPPPTDLREAKPVLSRLNHTFPGSLAAMLFTIRYAKAYLYLSSFIISHPAITNALVMASKRGVDVRVFTDKAQAGKKGFSKKQLLEQLLEADIMVITTTLQPLMHEKWMTADDAVYMNGSSNASNSAHPSRDPKTGHWKKPKNMEMNTFTCETPISEWAAKEMREVSSNPEFGIAVDDSVFGRQGGGRSC